MRIPRLLPQSPLRPRSATRTTVVGLAVALAASAVPAAGAATPVAHRVVKAPKPPAAPPALAAKGVHPIAAKPVAHPADAAAHNAPVGLPTWPTPSTVTLTVNSKPKTAEAVAGSNRATAPGSPVWAESAGSPASRQVRVTMLDHTTAQRVGVTGVVFAVQPANAEPAAPATRVGLDYAGFADAYGGNYASRLHLVELPACALTTPDDAKCRHATPIPGAANDVKAHSLIAPLSMSAGAPTVLAATTESASSDGGGAGGGGGDGGGSAGTYGQTTLKPSGSWSAGGSAGSFTYSYPITAPPAASALVPKLKLSYDSGSVDGQTAATQAQAGWLGDGWSTPQSFVEQSFTSCTDSPEGSAAPQAIHDLCYDGQILTLSLNGSSVSLVYDAASGKYQTLDDNGDVVMHITDAGNGSGTYNTDYWQVTDRSGTVYQFGRNRLPGWASGDAATNSVDSEPVYSAHSGDPCYKSAGFSQSFCTMAYRWNLDYVKDPHGNAMAYYYHQDTNSYAQNADLSGASVPTATATYVRDSHLDHIDYGFTDGNAYTVNGGHAPDQVQFVTGDRCVSGTCDPLNKTNAANWPDVPYDLNCASGATCYTVSPTNWSTVRLTAIKTQQWNGTSYAPVDSWAFQQTMPATGDGTSPTLWLAGITHTGSDTTAGGAAVTLPTVTFAAKALANRVDTSTLPPLTRMRISSITTETGEVIGVDYELANPCSAPVAIAPAANTNSCYPVYWTPQDFTKPLLDWFQKYQVSSVTQQDPTGGSPTMQTSYRYLGGGAWHYDDNELVKAKYRTYGQWRGFGDVRTFTGQGTDAQTESEATYYRGMSDDNSSTAVNLTDSQGGVHEDLDRLAGQVLETTQYDYAGGPVIGSSINSFWISPATASRARTGLPALTANATLLVESWTRQAATDPATGAVSWRRTETDTSYDTSTGSPTFAQPLHVYEHGDLTDPKQQRCTTTTYAAPNTAANLVDLPAEAETDADACGGPNPGGASVPTAAQINALTAPTTVARPADVVSDVRTFYDAPALAQTWPQPSAPAWPQAAPTLGDVSVSQQASDYVNGAFVYQTSSAAVYDSAGRTVSSYDALGHRTQTSYSRTNGLVAAVRTTNALNQTQTTTVDTLRGIAVGATDLNGGTTQTHYDGLGRMTAVWSAGRSTSLPPNKSAAYQISSTAPTAVTTSVLTEGGGYQVSTTLYDAMLRQRQTQNPTGAGGRLVTDLFYDSHGWTWKTNHGWWDSSTTPSTTLAGVPDAQVPNQDVVAFDGAGQPVLATSYNDSHVVSQTAVANYGDRVVTVPLNAAGQPYAGGTVKATVHDALGRTTELDEYTVLPTVKVSTSTGIAPITTVSVTGGTTQATRYAYDKVGSQTDVQDVATGDDWHTGYDLLGRATSRTDPDAGTSTVGYDAGGQVTQTTDARGKTLSYAYDALGRKVAEYDAAASAQSPANQMAAWVYDNSDNAVPGMPNPIGQLTASVSYPSGSAPASAAYRVQGNGFNVFGESLGETVTIPSAEGALAGTYSFGHKYSPIVGLLLQDSYPASPGGALPAETVTHGYSSALDLPVSLVGLSGSYTQNTSYNGFGQISETQLGTTPAAAADIVNTWDPHSGVLLDSQVTHPAASSTPIDELSYTYDPAGNPLTQTDSRWGTSTETQCYAYDTLDRLHQAWTATDSCAADPSTNHGATVGSPVAGGSYWTSWTFDPLGQRQSQTDHAGSGDTVTAYSYNANPTGQTHTLSGTTSTGPSGNASTGYAYDASGNTTQRTLADGTQQKLNWTDSGQLASVSSSAGTENYIYDADGSLLLQKDPTSTTLYLPDEQLTLNLASGAISGMRTYELPGGGEVVRNGGGADYSFLTSDLRGTALLSLDPSFTTAQWREETPYGAPRGTVPDSWAGGNRGFLGASQDSATGLTDVGARWYDPGTGRFISPDPVFESSDPQQHSGYSYSASNPVSFSDPTGLFLGPPGAWCNEPSCWPTGLNPGEAYQANGGNLTSTWDSPEWQSHNPNRGDTSGWYAAAYAQAEANAAWAAAQRAAAIRAERRARLIESIAQAGGFRQDLMSDLGTFNSTTFMSSTAVFFNGFFDMLGEKITEFGVAKYTSLIKQGKSFFKTLNEIGMNTRVVGGLIRWIGLLGLKAHIWNARQLRSITATLGENIGRAATGIGIAGSVFDAATGAISEWNSDSKDSAGRRALNSAIVGGFGAYGGAAGATLLGGACGALFTPFVGVLCGVVGGTVGGDVGTAVGQETVRHGTPAIARWVHGFEHSVISSAFHGFW